MVYYSMNMVGDCDFDDMLDIFIIGSCGVFFFVIDWSLLLWFIGEMVFGFFVMGIVNCDLLVDNDGIVSDVLFWFFWIFLGLFVVFLVCLFDKEDIWRVEL